MTDFYNVIKDGLDDSWCASIGTPQKPPANLNDGNTSSSQSASDAANDTLPRSANENSLFSQPEDSSPAAAAQVFDTLPSQDNDAMRMTVTPNPNKRRRQYESGDDDGKKAHRKTRQ